MPAAASLYRRHRPRTFADVVGQEHVVRTLRNAIERDKVHHAYLFVGSRGTGKTSMAKILAASLNCENGGPTITPCGVCDSCRSIAAATSLDVIEMDAASNNSVDDIRDLRERVAYAPVSGRSKVYILDEAHMLSTQAWNAFLKTLEEPPPHTIFVLATTEANKVLPTVVDRCHRFDFARPAVPEIAGVLRRVADAEGITIGEEAVALIARSATGSFRDALGTLEQLLAYSGTSIELADVLAVLGAADADLVFSTVDAIASGDAREALLAAARLADSGRDVGRFFGDLEAHARGLLVVQTLRGEVPAELRVTAEQDARLVEQARRVAGVDVIRLLDLLAAGLRAMKDGSDARTQLELALVKAADPQVDSTTRALLSRIERLEARLAGGGPPPAPSPSPHAPETPATAAAQAARAAAAQPDGGQGRASVAVAVEVESDEDPSASVAAIAVVDPEPEPPARPADLDLPAFSQLWPAVLESVAGENRLLAASLAAARPAALAGSELRLAWGQSAAFSKVKAEDPANKELIARAIRAVTGSSLRLAYELRTDADHAADPDTTAAPELTEDELIAKLVTEFDAEELPPDPPPRND